MKPGDLELMFALERSPLGSFAVMFADRLERPPAYEVGGKCRNRKYAGRSYMPAQTLRS